MTSFSKTKILTSIKSLKEISLVLNKGVDIIDFKDPSEGPLGAIPTKQIKFFLKSIPSDQLTSATIGNIEDIKTRHVEGSLEYERLTTARNGHGYF